MVCIKYVADGVTVGCLVFTHDQDLRARAEGGVDPGADPADKELLTLVITDNYTRVLRLWVHPDHIREIHPQDDSGLQVAEYWNTSDGQPLENDPLYYCGLEVNHD